jgi:hypothetical protein
MSESGGGDKRAKRPTAASLAFLGFALLAFGARADDAAPKPAPPDDGIIKDVMKKVGLAADPGQPEDFVVKARPGGEEDYVPVGRKAFVRGAKAKTPAELKAMEADFDAVQVRHNALRSRFPPAVKAVAAAEAAKAARDANPKKKPAAPASPQ